MISGFLNSICFPITVMGVLCALGIGAGYAVRFALGPSRAGSSLVIILSLIPWLKHHYWILGAGGGWLRDEFAGSFSIPFSTSLAGPAIVTLAGVITVAVPGRLRQLIAAAPLLAFGVSWTVTIPLVARVAGVPAYPLDNIPTIWLGIWTCAAMVFSFAYACLANAPARP